MRVQAGASASVTKLLGHAAPTPAERLLLEAALLSGDEAVTAWRGWTERRGLDAAYVGERRLLPAVYRNLARLGIEDERLPKLRGIHRHDWYRNQLQFAAAAELIERLERSGVPTLVLKGGALAVLHYRDAGSRPMSDVDILVPPGLAATAVDVLEEAGWRPNVPPPRDLLAVRHELCYRRGGEQEVDLHWRAFLYSAGDDAELWEDAVPLALSGTRTRALCAPDQLLHVLAHGLAGNPVSPVRWISDSVAVLRSTGSALDWDRFCSMAARRRLSYSAWAGLSYLQAAFEPSIPDHALGRLHATRASRGERALHRAMVARPLGVRRAVRMYRAAHRALSSAPAGGARRVGFASFVVQQWPVESPGRAPAYVAGRFAERYRRRRFRAARAIRA
jgi:Uncharacterised nucleotidyltransferase